MLIRKMVLCALKQIVGYIESYFNNILRYLMAPSYCYSYYS